MRNKQIACLFLVISLRMGAPASAQAPPLDPATNFMHQVHGLVHGPDRKVQMNSGGTVWTVERKGDRIHASLFGLNEDYSMEEFKQHLVVWDRNLENARSRGKLNACEVDLKNIGTALEMYAKEHRQHYPPTLTALVGPYLKYVPRCPSGSEDTYSASYRPTTDLKHYELYCKGAHHTDAGLQPDHPRYSSDHGLQL